MERELRALKRQETALIEAHDDEAVSTVRKAIHAKEATLRSFLVETKLTRQRDREGAVWRSIR